MALGIFLVNVHFIIAGVHVVQSFFISFTMTFVEIQMSFVAFNIQRNRPVIALAAFFYLRKELFDRCVFGLHDMLPRIKY